MKSAILYIVIFVTFSLSSWSASADSLDVVAQKILGKYGQNVFVVNAYTKHVNTKSKEGEVSRYKYQNVGTAFSFDNDGHLITINSVIKDAENVKVISNTGEKINARVLGCYSEGSINVLEIDPFNTLSIAKTSKSNDVNPGKTVFLLGIVKEEGLTAYTGVISDLKTRNGTFIIDVQGNPGTSGTPVFDKEGCLLGFVAYQIEDIEDEKKSNSSDAGENSHSCCYVVLPIECASAIARSIINRDDGKCGWLGIFSNFSAGSSDKKGVIIQRVIKDSPAEKSGLLIKDYIFEFNSVPVFTPLQLVEAITRTRAGDTVSIKVRRGNKNLSFAIILSFYPETN